MKTSREIEDMPDEVDFTGGHLGHFAGRLSRDTILVVIEPELYEKFPSSDAVNDALRLVLKQRDQDAA